MNITKAELQQLVELIDKLVDDDSRPWQDKKNAVESTAHNLGERFETSLEEFTAWFDTSE